MNVSNTEVITQYDNKANSIFVITLQVAINNTKMNQSLKVETLTKPTFVDFWGLLNLEFCSKDNETSKYHSKTLQHSTH